VSPEIGGLRVGVQGGGCSGLSYAMRLDTQARDRDKVFEGFGARVFVDPKSLLYLSGTTLEYEETLMRQGFVFQNPKCGAELRLRAARLRHKCHDCWFEWLAAECASHFCFSSKLT